MQTIPVTPVEAAAYPSAHPWAIQDPTQWCAVYTCSRYEKAVAQHMQRRAIECLLPTYRSVRRWKDRRKELDLPLFPSYVFVSIPLGARLRVLEVPGVVQIVSFNGKPAILPNHEIEAIRSGLASNAAIVPHPYLKTGSRVRVRSGPLTGVEGILTRRKEGFRLVLSIDLLMRSVAVEVDEADVEPLR